MNQFKRNIILEGCDNSGKTTLREFLHEQFPSRDVIHRSYTKEAVKAINAVWHDANGLNEDIIDRSSLISETVYSKVLGREPLVGINGAKWDLLRDNAVIIWCNPPFATVSGTQKEEMPGVLENLEAIYDEYIRFFRKYNGDNILTYDWTENCKYELLEQIKARI